MAEATVRHCQHASLRHGVARAPAVARGADAAQLAGEGREQSSVNRAHWFVPEERLKEAEESLRAEIPDMAMLRDVIGGLDGDLHDLVSAVPLMEADLHFERRGG